MRARTWTGPGTRPSGRAWLSAWAAAAVPLAVLPAAGQARAAALPGNCGRSLTTVTCIYTTGDMFEVPEGVSSLEVIAAGAAGGAGAYSGAGEAGGRGAWVRARAVPVSQYQGQALTVAVGSPGGAGSQVAGGAGGSPGGGPGGDVPENVPPYPYGGGGGGGYSGLLDGTTPLVIAAGGGGGSGGYYGGGDGGETGSRGRPPFPECPEAVPYPSFSSACGGGGGTRVAGGGGGAGALGDDGSFPPGERGTAGDRLEGGRGGDAPVPLLAYASSSGGGGGGGYYGGGGGGSSGSSSSGGGGGGSSFGPAGSEFGLAPNGPRVVISYTAPVISLVKSVGVMSFTGARQNITYTYTVENIGTDVTLHGIAVTDKTISKQPIACGTALAPDGKETCTATYTTTGADVRARRITDTATVTAVALTQGGQGQLVEATSNTVTLPLRQVPPKPGPPPPPPPPPPGIVKVVVVGGHRYFVKKMAAPPAPSAALPVTG